MSLRREIVSHPADTTNYTRDLITALEQIRVEQGSCP